MAEQKRRSDVIDAFRAMAIFIVLLFHYLVRWAPPMSPVSLYGYDHLYSSIFRLGEYGVHIFFVISGLVIAMTIVKSGSSVDFAVRRFARLYPAYIVATLLVTAVVVASRGPFHVSVKDFVTTLTMAAPHLGGRFVDGAYWSLLVEVKFYVWIAVCFLLLKDRFWMGIVAMGVLGIAIWPFAPRVADQILLIRFLPLFLIGMAGWYSIFNAQHRIAAILCGSGLIFYAINARLVLGAGHDPSLAWAAHVLILGSSFAMLALLKVWSSANLGPLAYVGRASYSWYLIHQRIGVIIIGQLTTRLGAPDMVAFGVATIVTIAIACAMFEFVEKPSQKLILKGWHHGRAHLLGKPREDGAAADPA